MPNKRVVLSILTAVCVLACVGQASSSIIRVKWDSPNNGPGNDWDHAYHTVTAGIAAAVSGDEVWVAAGTYVERITLKPGVALYGGFAGNETAREQRNWVTSVTSISGSWLGDVLTCPPGATGSTRADGFTIRGARNGRGIYCHYSSPTIANNTIAANSGAGIYCYYSSPTIANNTITANGDSGIHCHYSSPTIVNNAIADNTEASGGGIDCFISSPTIANNTLTGNSAEIGGGINCYLSSPTVTNNTITGNTAKHGGAIYCGGTSSSPVITNNILAFNSSGIHLSYGSPVLHKNDVYNPHGCDYSGLSPGTGDISLDPKLEAVTFGRVHIQPDSPCRDAGDDSAVQPGWVDIDWQARIQGAHVDIGADESDGAAWSFTPAIVRVSKSGNDANDGSSWALAKLTVQAGIDAASACGGEVWVASGVYTERIVLHAYAHAYGGFAGAETLRAERDWTANLTVLDGGGDGSVVRAKEPGLGYCTLDGFTVRNGKASYGGGIYCPGSSPVIANNVITDNQAGFVGGGIYCAAGSAATVMNNAVKLNQAPDGGGIGGEYGSLTIVGNVISANNASSDGGAMHFYGCSAGIMSNTVVGNGASNSGGLYGRASALTLANNIVALNSSGVAGSGGSWLLRNNDIYNPDGYNYSGPLPGTGDISEDPKFEAVEYGRVHIQPDSPCRDAGDDSWVRPEWLDVDGQARIQGAHVDIGADESDGTTWSFTPAIVRVSKSGNDANDGSSWALAKLTVQAGIDTASAVGGEVWVASGTYGERLVLPPYAHMYGGFAGTETVRSDRDWAANPTILDRGGGGAVVTATLGHKLSTVDGFIIRNGSPEGGIYCSRSSPTIANNTITGNSASKGGGIRCENSSPSIINNVITGNRSTFSGGAIYCHLSSPTIGSNTIAGNSASWYGGGVYCWESSPTIANNTLIGNIAPEGGGIYFSTSSPYVTNNIVAFNSCGIRKSEGGTPVLHNNDVYNPDGYNYSGLSAGTGDISLDPRLEAVGYRRVHIQPDSPCVDAGYDAVVQSGWVDMDGQARIQGAHVDIGADESDGTVWSFPPTIVRVSKSGDDTNDGSSWASAKLTVQAGIEAASVVGGEVWVASGIYDERIVLRSYAHVYGGFAGAETTRTQRDWSANPTVLDGQAGGTVVTIATGHKCNTIDGFAIRNGNALSGGGIYCVASSPVISNNTISGNSASSYGGGIYCWMCLMPTIVNNTITSNSASDGGGIACIGDSSIIANNTITANSASDGGGIYCSGSSATIANNTIAGNNAPVGGGIYLYESSPTVANNIVAFNSSGICRSGGSPVLHNNDFYNPAGYDYSGISAGAGDISADPLFVDTDDGDYHLTPYSPCIDAGWNDAPGLPLVDIDGQGRIWNGIVDIGADELWPLSVGIDIKPGAYPNPINLRSGGLVPVAILSEPGFDAASVDPTTVTFAGAPVATRGHSAMPMAGFQDVDGDGNVDLLLHFETRLLQLEASSTSATLTGKTYDGWPVEGSDSILVLPSPGPR